MAQSVTRRAALKKFGVGLAGCKTYLPKSDNNYVSCQAQCAFFCR
jgi:hypothetical protein